VKSNSQSKRRGNTTIEFVLVGIPLIFILLSIFEIARGMWTYTTLAYAVREGVRYSIMHGQGCGSPNTCSVTVANIATKIQTAGVGLDPGSVTLTFTTHKGVVTTCTITNCLTNNTVWPDSTSNAPGNNVKIATGYPFRTFLAVFWPGAGAPVNDSGSFYLRSSSQEGIQF